VALTPVEAAGLAALAAIVLGSTGGALAQEEGWHYSPLAGEGDRAALGCAYKSTPESFTCIAVRCEDDFSVGVHLHTSRPGGDAGRWRLDVDRETGLEIDAKPDGTPYHAKVAGEVTDVIEALKNGGVAYLDPKAGPALPTNGIPLTGSLYAINQALYFCAPKVGSGDEVTAVDGQDGAGDEAGEGRAEE
jgi:hypothetical protein